MTQQTAITMDFLPTLLAAARRGQYKFLRIEGTEYLFDVVADPQERANRKVQQAQLFAQLKAGWEKWNAEMIPYTEKNVSFSNKASPKVLPDRY